MGTLFETVINDGNGSQCRASYEERCMVFQRHGFRRQAFDSTLWVQAVDEWIFQRGGQRAMASEILSESAQVAAYYEKHVKEL